MTQVDERTIGWDKLGLSRQELIDVALGEAPADVVVKDAVVLSVNTGTFTRDEIAIRGNRIAALGDVDYAIGPDTRIVDAGGRTVIPGLVSTHVHQWHSGQNSTVWAQAHLLAGTTAAADGFYGCGIVAGVPGIRWFVEEALRTPLKLIFLTPTYSYAQMRVLGFPPSPRGVTAEETLEMIAWPESFGLEETGFELLLQRGERHDPNILRFAERCLELGKVVTGHGPSFPSERELNAWIAAGFSNNHEIVSRREAERQAELGLQVVLRDGPAMHDLPEAARAITEGRMDSRGFTICPDLATAKSIFDGQLDVSIRAAIRSGVDVVRAIQMCTVQAAEYFRISHDVGMIAPGRFADLVFVDSLRDLEIERVMANGEIVVEDGKLVGETPQPDYPLWLYETFDLDRRFGAADLRVPAPEGAEEALVRIIDVCEQSIDSRELHLTLPVRDGGVQADPANGVNKVVVIDRLRGDGDFGVGFVRGFGIREGAIGQTINFNQCIVAVGADDEQLAAAVNAIVDRGGAYVAVRDGEVFAELPTPLLGLAADLPYEESERRSRAVTRAWEDLGCELESPMTLLEFTCESKMPTLRISPHGLSRVALDETGTQMDLDSYALLPVLVEEDGGA